MNGAGGVDTVVFHGSAAVNANLTTGIATGVGNDTLANFENLNGTSGNDTLTGSAGANTILGNAGNDTMDGAGGVDTASFLGFVGGERQPHHRHRDRLRAATRWRASRTSTARLGNDTLTGGAANNTIDGGLGNDTMNGAGGIDTAAFAGTSR